MSTNLRHALVAAVMISLGFLSGCGQEITAATSCKDFMEASQSARDDAVNRIAADLNAPNSTSPLGRPNIEYMCAQRPQATLGDVIAMTG